jgi:glycosyltransferase involved in cell wall biosynthesis
MSKLINKATTLILVHVTTIPETFNFFRGQINYLKAQGFEVHAVSSGGGSLIEIGEREAITTHAIDMTRKIDPLKDLIALAKLYRLFRGIRPDIVHANTPKAGLLGVLAARLARVPVVVYGMRGLRFETGEGLRRGILYSAEALTCRLAHRVICNSFSNRSRAISLGLCQEDKIRVLAQGSSNGVDAAGRFNPRNLPPTIRPQLRDDYQIPPDALVVGYVGRIVRDKGIAELEGAWQVLKDRFTDLFLLLVGPIESHDPVPPQVLDSFQKDPRVRLAGPVRETAPFYAAMDLLVLPSYREGLPNTPLEAAAMELPVVATRVDGCVDAVVDGVTGILIPPRDSGALADAISRLLQDPEERRQMGLAGRERVCRDFRPELIWQALYENYLDLLNSKQEPFHFPSKSRP